MKEVKEVMSRPLTQMIPLSQIVQKENSRANYDENEMNELMQSIKRVGQLQAATVRPSKGGKFELLAGNRRFIAVRKLGLPELECKVKDHDKEGAYLINAVENMQRVDVPLVQQGRIFTKLLKRGLTSAQIATRIGIKQPKVNQCISLYNGMPKEFRSRVVSGTMGSMKNVSAVGSRKTGRIPAITAFRTLGVATKNRLSMAERKKLLLYASKDGATSEHIRCVGLLMSMGQPLNKAIKMAESVRMIVCTIPMDREKANALELKEKRGIRNIIIDRLAADPEMGVLPLKLPGSGNHGPKRNKKK